jgi:hypothetical protein
MLFTRKGVLQLFEEVLIGIVNVIFEDNVDRDSTLGKCLKVGFDSGISNFVVLKMEKGISRSEESRISL